MNTLFSFYFPDGMDSIACINQGLRSLQKHPNIAVYDMIINHVVEHYTFTDIEKNFDFGIANHRFVEKLLLKNPQAIFNSRHERFVNAYTLDGRDGEKLWVLNLLSNTMCSASFLLQALTFYHDDTAIQKMAVKKLLQFNDKSLKDFACLFDDQDNIFTSMLDRLTLHNIPKVIEMLKTNPQLFDLVTDNHIGNMITFFERERNSNTIDKKTVSFILLSMVLNHRPEYAIAWCEKAEDAHKQYVLWLCQHPNFVDWLYLTGQKIKLSHNGIMAMKIWSPQLDNLTKITNKLGAIYTSLSDEKAIMHIIETAIKYGNDFSITHFDHPLLRYPLNNTTFEKKTFITTKEKALMALGSKRKAFLETLIANGNNTTVGEGLVQYAEKKYANKKEKFEWNLNIYFNGDEMSLL